MDEGGDKVQRGRTVVSRRVAVAGLGGVLIGAANEAARAQGPSEFWNIFRPGNDPAEGPSKPAARVRTVSLDAPDFSRLHERSPFLAGVRPHRDGGMRIELRRPVDTPTGVKHVIHNYGHGGGGVSLAFGAAETVREHVQTAIETSRHGNAPTSFAVIGAGVIGLTTALAVRERWPSLPLTIYAREIDCERTTSWLAGGQFANPASLPEYYSDVEQSTMTRHLAKSEQRFRDLGRAGLHAHYGIARRVSYSMASSSSDVRLRMGTAMRSARSYETWLIDPTRLLPALNRDLAARQVAIMERTFASLEDVYALPESIVINCAGLGARDLFGDTHLQGRRGHLVRLANPRKLGYFLTSWCGSGPGAPRYLFARHDDIVIGGSILPGREEGGFNPDNPGDVATCQRILRNARGLFETNGAICG